MFIFNLDFNQTQACVLRSDALLQHRGQAGPAALAAMVKNKASLTGKLQNSAKSLAIIDRCRRATRYVDALSIVL